MKQIQLNANQLPDNKKIDLAVTVLKCTQNNKYFKSAAEIRKALTKALDEFIEGRMESTLHVMQKGRTVKDLRKNLVFHLEYMAAFIRLRAFELPKEAEKIIISSGFATRAKPQFPYDLFRVKAGKKYRSVAARMKATKGAVYLFQISADGKTWDQKVSRTCKYLFEELEPGAYWFRVAVVKGDKQDEFTVPVMFSVN